VGNNEEQEHAVDDDGSNKWVRVARAMVMAMRVAGDKEGKGNKENNGVGDKDGVQQRGQWQ
jgi:hypothetical protein